MRPFCGGNRSGRASRGLAASASGDAPAGTLGLVAVRTAIVTHVGDGAQRALRCPNRKLVSRMETQRPRLLERVVIALAVPVLYALGWTLRPRELGDMAWSLRTGREIALWALWHETLLPGTWFYRRRGVHVMISASRDGERIARITRYLGYEPVRGSTS